MPSITIDVPAPATDAERKSARAEGEALNPVSAYEPEARSLKRPDPPPDSPVVDGLLVLSRTLWDGRAATVELPDTTTTDGERRLLAWTVQMLDPGERVTLDGTGIGSALDDLYHALRGAMWGVPAEWARAAYLLENALWEVRYRCNAEDDNDRPLRWAYGDLFGERNEGSKGYKIAPERERFRQAVKAAEKAMDLADRLLAG